MEICVSDTSDGRVYLNPRAKCSSCGSDSRDAARTEMSSMLSQKPKSRPEGLRVGDGMGLPMRMTVGMMG